MKDQSVIVCIEKAADAPLLLAWAKLFAGRLRNKRLVALNVSKDGSPSWLKEVGIPYIGLKGDWKTAIEGLPTMLEGILAITLCDPQAPRQSLANPHTLHRQFSKCKIAYVCIHPESIVWQSAPSVALTLTHKREGKEKLVWASYLARFMGAHLTIAHPNYRDEGLQRRLKNNMKFVEKMYSPLKIDYSEYILGSSTREDEQVLEQVAPDMLVARATDTRERTLFDLFSVLPEYRLMGHSSHTPILFLNPRDDLYILCD